MDNICSLNLGKKRIQISTIQNILVRVFITNNNGGELFCSIQDEYPVWPCFFLCFSIEKLFESSFICLFYYYYFFMSG